MRMAIGTTQMAKRRREWTHEDANGQTTTRKAKRRCEWTHEDANSQTTTRMAIGRHEWPNDNPKGPDDNIVGPMTSRLGHRRPKDDMGPTPTRQRTRGCREPHRHEGEDLGLEQSRLALFGLFFFVLCPMYLPTHKPKEGLPLLGENTFVYYNRSVIPTCETK